MSQVTRFGPGSLESIAVRTWTVPRTERKRLKARVEGVYTVYCGAGWQHNVAIRQEFTGWVNEKPFHEDVRALFDAHGGDEVAAATLAERAIEYQLEDWFDPCDAGDDPAESAA